MNPRNLILGSWIQEGPFLSLGYVWLGDPVDGKTIDVPLIERIETLCLN